MFLRKWKAFLLAGVIVSQAAIVSESEAGQIMDWLFSCRRAERTTVNYGTPYYGGATSCDPCNSCSVPVSSCDPCSQPVASFQPQTFSQPVSNCQTCTPTAIATQPIVSQPIVSQPIIAAPRRQFRTPTRYMPRTNYRTQWVPTPVTYYRPVSSIDPTTGAHVTTMRPCTTTTYRPIRVRQRWRPFARWFRRNEVQAAPAAPVYGYGQQIVGQGQVIGQPASSGCASCSSGIAVTTPGTTVSPIPAGTYPGAAAPGAITTPGGGVPADRNPTLSPSGIQPNGQGASFRGFTPPVINRTQPSRPVNTEKQPAAPFNRKGVTPIPDPHAAPEPKDDNRAPQLLDPRNRTAGLPVLHASYTRVTWPERTATQKLAAPKRLEKPQTPRAEEPQWDTGGWHSAR